MADKETVLVIRADAKGAQREIEGVEKAVDRVRRASGNLQTSEHGTAGQSTARASVGGGGGPPNVPGDGRKLGSEIGKFFVAYVASKAADTAFSFFKDPVTSNARVDQIQATFHGGLGGAMAGAAVGASFGRAAGVWGAAAGGILGGGLAFLGEDRKIQQRTILARYNRQLEDKLMNQGIADQTSDEAFQLRLSRVTRSKKMEALRDRIKQLTEGDGKHSLASLKDAMVREEDLGRTDSSIYQELAGRRRFQMARVAQLKAQLRMVERRPLSQMISGGDVTDSLQSRGISVGASVNVADTNSQLLVELRKINTNLEKMSSAPDAPAPTGVLAL